MRMWYVVYRNVFGDVRLSRPHLTCLAATEHEEFLLTLTSVIRTEVVRGPQDAGTPNDVTHSLHSH